MTKQVMVRAWELAKEGVSKFGGKVKEYFASALSLAWSEVKAMANEVKEVVIELAEGSRRHKSWVAEIVGTDARFGLKREFIKGSESDEVKGLFFTLVDGKVYDINNASGGRYYATVRNGEVVRLGENEVKAMFA